MDFESKYFRIQASEDGRQVVPVSCYVDCVRTACIDNDTIISSSYICTLEIKLLSDSPVTYEKHKT